MLSEKLKAWPFYVLPHHAISGLMYWLSRIELRPMKNLIIRVYTALIDVDMSEAVDEDRFAYASLNAFFTRSIKPECRPFADEPDLLCPVDGAVSQAGTVEDGHIFQAKGHSYVLEKSERSTDRRFQDVGGMHWDLMIPLTEV